MTTFTARFTPRLPIAAITDEFSPTLSEALPFMQEIGMTGAELRVVDGKNILDLSDDELKRTREALKGGTASGVDRLARSKVRLAECAGGG